MSVTYERAVEGHCPACGGVFGLAGSSPGGHSPEPGSTYRVIVPHEGDGSGWVWERISGDDG